MSSKCGAGSPVEARADALAGFFAKEGEAAAGSAAEAAFTIAGGFDQFAGQGGYGAGFFVNVAIAAQIAGVVEDDLLIPRSQKRDLGHP